jgi:hypothetical protein
MGTRDAKKIFTFDLRLSMIPPLKCKDQACIRRILGQHITLDVDKADPS